MPCHNLTLLANDIQCRQIIRTVGRIHGRSQAAGRRLYINLNDPNWNCCGYRVIDWTSRRQVRRKREVIQYDISAAGILVFPKIVKAGFLIGGQTGSGALLVDGNVDGYYRSGGASIGMQAGAQSYGYVLFLMHQENVDWLHAAKGWEIGVGPSVVVVDKGVAANLTTKTITKGIYAFVFGQKGLMAGMGIQGNKIHRES